MAYPHPGHARFFARAAAATQPEIYIRGRAQQIEATKIQDRKRKRDDLWDERRVTRDDFASRDIHLDIIRRGTEASSRRQDSVQSSKRPHLDPSVQLGRYTVKQPSNRRHFSSPTPPPRLDDKKAKDKEPPKPKVNRAHMKPNEAHEEASEYPNLLDWEAWQRLAREPRANVRKQNADMYQNLRQRQCPKGRDFIDWKAIVVQETRELRFDSRLKRSKVTEGLGIAKKEEFVKEEVVKEEVVKEGVVKEEVVKEEVVKEEVVKEGVVKEEVVKEEVVKEEVVKEEVVKEGVVKEEVVKEEVVKVEVVKKQEVAEVQEKKVERVEKRQYKDGGFDIDIYGDEETRELYEPWIRSRAGKT